MRNLYKPVRYNVASIQAQQTLGGDCMESNENGIWVEFRDYLRLLEDYKLSQQWKREADAETLKFDSGDWFASKTLPERIKHIIEANAFSNDQWKDVDAENARLKAEVERLTELNATISLRYDATKSMLDGCAKEIEEMEAEVERLTSDIQMEKENEDRLVREWQKANNEVYGLQRQVAALIDELERLRKGVQS